MTGLGSNFRDGLWSCSFCDRECGSAEVGTPSDTKSTEHIDPETQSALRNPRSCLQSSHRRAHAAVEFQLSIILPSPYQPMQMGLCSDIGYLAPSHPSFDTCTSFRQHLPSSSREPSLRSRRDDSYVVFLSRQAIGGGKSTSCLPVFFRVRQIALELVGFVLVQDSDPRSRGGAPVWVAVQGEALETLVGFNAMSYTSLAPGERGTCLQVRA